MGFKGIPQGRSISAQIIIELRLMSLQRADIQHL